MVRGLLANHIPAAHAPVDCNRLQRGRPEDGLYAGATGGGFAVTGGRLSFCQDLGGRAFRLLCRFGDHFPWSVVVSCLPGGPVGDGSLRRLIPERAALFLRMV